MEEIFIYKPHNACSRSRKKWDALFRISLSGYLSFGHNTMDVKEVGLRPASSDTVYCWPSLI
jgi:hypothetical protein